MGTLGVIDHDVVTVSNLHRQVMHSTSGAHVRMPKAASAKEAVLRLNPNVQVDVVDAALTAHNAKTIISAYVHIAL